ncbi:MAG: hypothetical protein IPK27_06355 [Rhodanobacteraceae bacterium]|nr:hypothetical protein [Rhodanobacteraceae bacterium]
MSSRAERARRSGAVKITPQDIDKVRRRGPAALAYYREIGLAEVRARATALTVAGAMPIFGALALGWSPASMMVFMIFDAAVTLALDWVRLPLARRWMEASHARDGEAGEIVGIVDGLEDGTGMRTPRAGTLGPLGVMGMGLVVSVFMVPATAAAIEPIGLSSLAAVLAEPWFLHLLAGDAALRLLNALHGVWRARSRPPGEVMIVAESGNVVMFYLGLLVLVWLPLSFGHAGLLMLFAAIYLFRIGFGLFSLWWMPRAVAALQRRLDSGDFSVARVVSEKLRG